MFVRWKRRYRQRIHYGDMETGYGFRPGWIKYAVLCKSERVNGKPRQKFIVHLGDIAEDNLQREIDQYHFWHQSRWILNNIPKHAEEYGLTPEEATIENMKKIVQQLEQTVPAMTQEQMHEYYQRTWGHACRASRSQVEERFFLEPYSLDPEEAKLERGKLVKELGQALGSMV